MDIKEADKILYLCDTKDCCTSCNIECKHTSNIDHAKNFERMIDGSYWEKEQSKFDKTGRKVKTIVIDSIVIGLIVFIAQLIGNDLKFSITLATGLITGYIIGLLNVNLGEN